MVKIQFTYGTEPKEGFTLAVPDPMYLSSLTDDSIEEISGDNVLEKVPSLIGFIEHCYRILAPGGVAKFSSPFYASNGAWTSPLTVRALSESSLNFSNKAWREQNKYTEAPIIADFEVQGHFAIAEDCMSRAEEVRAFWVNKYLNVAQAVMYTLTKK